MDVRTETYVMLVFGTTAKAYIHIYPQQKWNATDLGNGFIGLTYKKVDIKIPVDDFNKYFIEIN